MPIHGTLRPLIQQLYVAARGEGLVVQQDHPNLRATGITWEALAGTGPLRIQQRAGHEHFETTQWYIRQAEAVGLASDPPFPARPSSLVWLELPRIASGTIRVF